jgi:hypothetical protein
MEWYKQNDKISKWNNQNIIKNLNSYQAYS